MRFMEADSKLSRFHNHSQEPLLPTSKKVGNDSLRPENIPIADDSFSVWQVGTLRVVSGPVHTLAWANDGVCRTRTTSEDAP